MILNNISKIYTISIYAIFAIIASMIWLINPELPFETMQQSMGIGYDIIIYLLLWSPIIILFTNNSSLSKDIFYDLFITFATAIMIISLFHSTRTGINITTIYVLLCIIVGVILKKQHAPQPYFYIYIAYFIISAISIIWSNDKQYGLNILMRSTLWLTMPLAFCFINIKQSEYTRLLKIAYFAATIFVLISIITWIYQVRQLETGFAIWFLPGKHGVNDITVYTLIFKWLDYDHPSYNAIGVIFGLIAGLYLYKQKEISLFNLILFSCLSFILVWITQSRIGIIMFVATFILCPYMFIKTKQQFLIFSSILFVCGLCVTYILFGYLGNYFHIDEERAYMFPLYAECIKKVPILGVGLGGMNPENILNLTGEPYKFLQYDHIYPHNQFLGDWMQTGIFGFLCLLAIISYNFYISIKRNNIILFIFMANMLLFMIIEMPFYILKGTTFFVCITCFLLSQDPKSDTD